MIIKKKITICKCERCGYEWIPNNEDELPVKCAKCNSPYWNKKRRHQTEKQHNTDSNPLKQRD